MRNGGQMSDLRQKVLTALAKPTPQTEDDLSAAFRDGRGLAGEFALHVLAGHDLTDYGTYAAAIWGQSGASVTEGPGKLL